MLASGGVAASCDEPKADVLNQPAWEEAILFACDEWHAETEPAGGLRSRYLGGSSSIPFLPPR